MSAFACRYTALFQVMSEIDGELHVTFTIMGKTKVLKTSSAPLIAKLKEWNLGSDIQVRLYYERPDLWDVQKIDYGRQVDKVFRQED